MIWLVTSLLGSIRNFVKYKQFKPLIFMRTPFIYCILFICLQTTNIWKILIFERWVMLIYKTIVSFLRKDYILKKEKYIQKYGLRYDN